VPAPANGEAAPPESRIAASGVSIRKAADEDLVFGWTDRDRGVWIEGMDSLRGGILM